MTPKFFDTMKVFAVLALTSVAMATRIQLRFRDSRTSEEVTHILERCDQKDRYGRLVVTYKSGDDIQLVNHPTEKCSVADQDGNVQPHSANAWALSIKSDEVNAEFNLCRVRGENWSSKRQPLNFASKQPQTFKPYLLNRELPAGWTQKHNTLFYYKNVIHGGPWLNGMGADNKRLVSKNQRPEQPVFTEDLKVTISRCGPQQTTNSKSEEEVTISRCGPQQTTISQSEEEREMAELRAEVERQMAHQPTYPATKRRSPKPLSGLDQLVADLSAKVITEAVEKHQAAELTKLDGRRRLTAIDRESATAAHRRVLKRVRGY